MRMPYLLVPALALGLFASAANAQEAPLGTWEQLSAAERELLLQPLRERWDAADAEGRQKMMAHARRWRDMPPEARARARQGRNRYDRLAPGEREQLHALYERTRHLPEAERRHALVLFHVMRGMNPAQREALRAQWAGMSASEREAWVRQQRPAHPPHPRGRPAAGER